MPRSARLLINGGTYHLLTRGNNNQTIFHEEADHQRYLQLLSFYARDHCLQLYHFVLMPNHVHLVLQAALGEAVSKAMRGLNLAYALYYQKRYIYRGHVWQGRFKSVLIDRDSFLLGCGRYIELNPVRSGLVQHPRDYPWSSYRFYGEGTDHPLIARNPLYELLGASSEERQQRYRQFIHEGMRPQPREALGRSASHSAQQHERLMFLSAGRSRGRPRKVQKMEPSAK